VATVSGFDVQRGVVLTSRGDVPYDRLILASGRRRTSSAWTTSPKRVRAEGSSERSTPSHHVMRCFEGAIAAAIPESEAGC